MKKTLRIVLMACLSAMLLSTGCASAPPTFWSRRQIWLTRRNAAVIDISRLPLAEYPSLAKFTQVRGIVLDTQRGTYATDDALRALASVGLTNVTWITMTNCRLITDAGVQSLTNMESLTGLGLEGTSITDRACEVMAKNMRLSGVNVANCPGITLNGIKDLAGSKTISDLGFSADNITQGEIANLIRSFGNIKHWGIVDLKHRLDSEALETIGLEAKTQVIVMPTGALQNMYGIRRQDDRDHHGAALR